jgi:hypothetical protein
MGVAPQPTVAIQQPAPGLISPTGSAADMSAQILAAEYSNWEQQFKPIEQTLLGQSSLQDPNILTDAVSQAGTAAGQTADTMQGVEQRAMESRGIAPTAQQQMVNTRLNGLSRAASVAGAQNQARQQVSTQDELIAIGSAPNPNIATQSANAKYSGGQ